MNTIVFHVVVPDSIRMDRMRELGTTIATTLRKAIKEFETNGVSSKSELLMGTPGFTLVLGMANNHNKPNQRKPTMAEEL